MWCGLPTQGLSPGLHRQFLFTGVRLGLYEPVKRLFYKGVTPSCTCKRPLVVLCRAEQQSSRSYKWSVSF